MTTLTTEQVVPPFPTAEAGTQKRAANPCVSPEEYANLDDDGHKYELVDGQLQEKHMNDLSTLTTYNLNHELDVWARRSNVGLPFVEPRLRCFPLAPNQIRVPDVAFFTAERLAQYQWGQTFFAIAPDLVIEVISPNDKIADLERKIDQYQRAGVKHLWTVNPELKIVRIHRGPGDLSELVGDNELTDHELLPGFRCPLPTLFTLPGQSAPRVHFSTRSF